MIQLILCSTCQGAAYGGKQDKNQGQLLQDDQVSQSTGKLHACCRGTGRVMLIIGVAAFTKTAYQALLETP